MKKLCFLAVLAIFGLTTMSAQGDDSGDSNDGGFRIGLNAGIPVGDFSDWYSFTINLDIQYDWAVSDDIDVGLGAGYTCYFEDSEFDLGSFDFIPVYGSVDFNVSDDFSIGGDVGYAIAVSGNGGDLMWRGVLRYQVSDDVDITGRYNSVTGSGASVSYASVGLGYSF